MKWKFWFLIVLLLLLVIFVTQNYETIEIKFLFWGFTTSRAIVLFFTLTLGMVIGWTTAVYLNRKQNQLIEKELDN
ncbi:MAG: LapA family protein [Candidatus Omnitrophica bacterium]|nr:LapA family protein [Candidatus Omnitrophota bacterium]